MPIKKMQVLVEQLADVMNKKKLKLAVAESCTGGMIASFITDLTGSSQWFERGFVTYSNLAKQDMLKVDGHLISTHGAVSQQVAIAMAEGALKYSAADISLSVTGIAGPLGGSPDKPVGTVHFAWSGAGLKTTHHSQQHFKGTRHQIRLQACFFALTHLYDLINSYNK